MRLRRAINELDLTADAGMLLMDVAAFDGSDCHDAGQCRLGCSPRTLV